jgi:hypothetical protein
MTYGIIICRFALKMGLSENSGGLQNRYPDWKRFSFLAIVD